MLVLLRTIKHSVSHNWYIPSSERVLFQPFVPGRIQLLDLIHFHTSVITLIEWIQIGLLVCCKAVPTDRVCGTRHGAGVDAERKGFTRNNGIFVTKRIGFVGVVAVVVITVLLRGARRNARNGSSRVRQIAHTGPFGHKVTAFLAAKLHQVLTKLLSGGTERVPAQVAALVAVGHVSKAGVRNVDFVAIHVIFAIGQDS